MIITPISVSGPLMVQLGSIPRQGSNSATEGLTLCTDPEPEENQKGGRKLC